MSPDIDATTERPRTRELELEAQNQELKVAAEAVIRSVINDNAFHGDILSRETIHASDKLRLVLSRQGIEIEVTS